jgi:hypothetical protein
MDFVQLMQSRVKELVEPVDPARNSVDPSPVLDLPPLPPSIVMTGDVSPASSTEESSWEVIDVGCVVCKEGNKENPSSKGADQMITCSSCPRHYHTYCVGLRKIPPFGTKTEQDILIREKYLKRHFGDWKCPRCLSHAKHHPHEGAVIVDRERGAAGTPESFQAVGGTGDDSSTLLSSAHNYQNNSNNDGKHSLSSPSSRLSYSVTTSGGGVIVTDKVRTLTSPTGQPFPPFPSHVGGGVGGSSGISSSASSLRSTGSAGKPTKSSSFHPISPNFRSIQDQIAILVAMLSSAGIGIEELMTMNEEKQRETILNVISKRHPEFNFEGMNDHRGNLDLATAMKGILAHSKTVTSDTKITSILNSDDDYLTSTKSQVLSSGQASYYKNEEKGSGGSGGLGGMGSGGNGGNGGNGLGGGENLVKTAIVSSSSGKSSGAGGGSGIAAEGESGSGKEGGSGSSSEKKADPRAAMLENLKKRQQFGSSAKLNLEKNSEADGPLGEKKYSALSRSLSGGVNGASHGPNTVTIAKGNVDNTKVKDIPEFSSYFTQLKSGIPKSALVDKIIASGVLDNADTANSVLSLDPEKPLPGDFKQKFNILVTMATHPKYEKFYKMLKVGISKDVVKAKMADSGLDPTVLEKDPDAPVPLSDSAGGSTSSSSHGKSMYSLPSFHVLPKSDDNIFISVEEQHKYVKYIKMQQMGMPIDQVKRKMIEEGLDPENLNRLPPVRSTGGSGSGNGSGGGGSGGGGSGGGSNKENNKEKDQPSQESNEKIPLGEHPKYAKYFKMLKIGLDKEAVQAKMQLEGMDPSILDRDPKEMVSLNEQPEKENDKPKVAVKDHPKYAKFFQMLKVGVPHETVKAKMRLEGNGVNPDFLDKDPNELIPTEEEVAKVPVGEHPLYVKFFKMLKVGLPSHVIKAKMEAEGIDSSIIDRDPNELIPLEEKKDEVPMVPANEHPLYQKFFKMLKLGVPVEVIKAKMALEKANPDVLDKDPSELIPLEDGKAGAAAADKSGKVNPLAGLMKGRGAAAQQKQRKKKLYWKAIDASQVNENSLWADPNLDELNIDFDEEEFNQLFVEQEDPNKAGKGAVAEAKNKQKKEAAAKKQKVMLIDMKRAQNGGIALARIRFPFDELKRKIKNMDDEGLTTDQFKSLTEYLPTPDEQGALKNYKGEMEAIGVAERYMMTMLGFTSAEKRIQCMMYKQGFRARYLECRTKITKVQNACDDVKLSGRLKKVLKYILKVGNQLNDGEEHKGFTVDSLLKLQSAKAYDKKTTVLQYVITLIFRNDEDCLKFPDELKHVAEASRLSFDIIVSEKTALRQEFITNLNIVEDIRNNDPDSDTNAMLDFLTKVSCLLVHPSVVYFSVVAYLFSCCSFFLC